MNAKISVFVIFVKVIIYLLLYNLHDSAFSFKIYDVKRGSQTIISGLTVRFELKINENLTKLLF